MSSSNSAWRCTHRTAIAFAGLAAAGVTILGAGPAQAYTGDLGSAPGRASAGDVCWYEAVADSAPAFELPSVASDVVGFIGTDDNEAGIEGHCGAVPGRDYEGQLFRVLTVRGADGHWRDAYVQDGDVRAERAM